VSYVKRSIIAASAGKRGRNCNRRVTWLSYLASEWPRNLTLIGCNVACLTS